MGIDNLFQSDNYPEQFCFDDQVTPLFDDMLNRSVPFYQSILTQIAECTMMPNIPEGLIYDLGCSTGALVQVLSNQGNNRDYVGIDASESMIKAAESKKWSEKFKVKFEFGDITTLSALPNASIIVCNLVLQFIPLDIRESRIKHLYQQLNPGGVLLVVEKLKQADKSLQSLYTDNFYQYKKKNGYSEIEIHRKEASLTNVLWSQTNSEYLMQIKESGFKVCDIFFKWYNFVGYIAVK